MELFVFLSRLCAKIHCIYLCIRVLLFVALPGACYADFRNIFRRLYVLFDAIFGAYVVWPTAAYHGDLLVHGGAVLVGSG